jgi:hypothetical protein
VEGLVRGIAVTRVLGRLAQVADRPAVVPAQLKVLGQFGRDRCCAVAEAGLQALAQPPVELPASRRGQALVQHVLVEPVPEAIAAGHRPVRPFADSRGLQELLPPRQPLAPLLHGDYLFP